MKPFDKNNKKLRNQFDNIQWINTAGVSPKNLEDLFVYITKNEAKYSKAVLKAKIYELLLTKAPIAIDYDDIFQDKLYGKGLMSKQRLVWEEEVQVKHFPEESKLMHDAWDIYGAFWGGSDFGHTSPNSELLLKIGIPGLLERIERHSQKENLSPKEKEFYLSCSIVLQAIISFILRLAKAVKSSNPENADALINLSKGAPTNLYEAMQLLIIYFFVHEFIGGTRVRSLGRLDVLFSPFYFRDISSGRYTKEECINLIKFFLNKFWAARIDYDLPFALGGLDSEGKDVTNELSFLIVNAYKELDIYSPKIHIRISKKTPEDFIKLILDCIRKGTSSFVFINDSVAIKSLKKIGIEESDAINYIPIGCYEPAVWGVEVGCTGNGGVNMAKAIELVITNGADFQSGTSLGVQTGDIDNFEAFSLAVKQQLKFMAEYAMDYITKIEGYYDQINPDPLLSSMYDNSVELGLDLYEGGAKYNNSSFYFHCIASLVDSMAAVKKIVYEDKLLSLDELFEVLKADWEGYESLRHFALTSCEKYGNNAPFTNSLARELSEYVASLTNNRPNGRGGVFKAALFSIDYCFHLGAKTMATPDGRRKGDPLSKNLCATTAMDRNGVTALIQTVTEIDHSNFPNGSVLDIILHPSAVRGNDGLDAFYGLLKTYFSRGGFALHGNVFNVEHLKAAQREPEKYQNMQVRVCGWNAYFVNLTKEEQDAFILQAENNN